MNTDINTEYGCFSSFKDVYQFMLDERINSISLSANYWGVVIPKNTYTLEQILSIIKVV